MRGTFDFAGLPGVKAKIVKGPFFTSASGAIKALRTHRTAASAGDHGSIQVWIDDAGAYRGQFQRHHVTLDAQTFATKKALQDWVAQTLPRQRRPDA